MISADKSECVNVFCRVRPPIDSPKNATSSSGVDQSDNISVVNDRTIHTIPPVTSAAYKNGCGRECDYSFTKIFDASASQGDVFHGVSLPLVKDLLCGRNGLIFTYGVTGSGKTFTMQGKSKMPGMLPRVLDTIFNSVGDRQTKKYVIRPDRNTNDFIVQSEADAMMERQQLEILPRQGTPSGRGGPASLAVDEEWLREITKVTNLPEPGDRAYAVFVSYVEIYNNYVYDLLDELFEHPVSGSRTPQSKTLREDCRKMMFVCGSTEIEVKTAEEAYGAFLRGRRRRKVAHTVLNTESSRSHSVFTIRVVAARIDKSNGEVIMKPTKDTSDLVISQLSLVDLAGSERSQRTGHKAGDRLREAGNINNTLMVLRKCIECLRANQQRSAAAGPGQTPGSAGEGVAIVPYRDSRLTTLFKNYFEGYGKVRVLVCISTQSEEFDETVNVLKFAEDTQEVRVASRQPPVPRTPVSGRRPGMPPPPSPSLGSARRVQTPLSGPPSGRRPSDSSDSSSSGSDSEGDLHGDGWDAAKEAELLAAVACMNESSQAYVSSLPPWMSSVSCDMSPSLAREAASKVRESRERRLEAERATRTVSDLIRERTAGMKRPHKRLRRRLADAEESVIRSRQEKQVLERRVRSLEQKNEKLARSVGELESEKKSLTETNADLNSRVRREVADRQRLKEHYQAKFQLSQQQHEETRRQLQDQYANAVEAKERKLTALRNLANTPDSTRSTPRPPTAPKPRLGRYGGNTPTPSTGNVRRLRQNFSPPPPHANPRFQHRRSRSADERWVDHHSKNEVPTGTVLQSAISGSLCKRKSVTKLDAKDMTSATKYLLTHQQADDEGNLETHLFKGDVIPTVGGGAAIVFNDVESLRQSSPVDSRAISGPSTKARKRSLSQPQLGERQELDALDQAMVVDDTELQQRCGLSAQGGIVSPHRSKRLKESRI